MLVVALALVVGSAAGCTEGGSGQSQQPDTTKQGETTESTGKTTPRTTPQPKQNREKKERSTAPPEDITAQALCAFEKYADAEHGGDLSAAGEKREAEEGPEGGPAGPARLKKDMADRGYTCTNSEALERAEQRRQEHRQEQKDQPSTKKQR